MILDGTTYKAPAELARVLERLRRSQERVIIVYGDTKTGRPWGGGCLGRIGRSMGPVKIPLIIHNRRCYGGPGLLDDCILEIRHSNKKRGGVIYTCSKYRPHA